MRRHRGRLAANDFGWWRFNQYGIENGVIRPSENGILTWYDPWIDFQQIRSQPSGQPAYAGLVRLVRTLDADPAMNGRMRNLSPESKAAIQDWCSHYGLLGVLLTRWESVTLSPRKSDRDPNLWLQKRYVRGAGTNPIIHHSEGDRDRLRSSALVRPLDQIDIQEESLGRTWGRFFPSVPPEQRETFEYPIPYSESFWQLYAEPVVEFWHAAKLFASLFESLGPKTIPKETHASSEAREAAIARLNVLRKPVSQLVVTDEEGLRQQWASPSLLASFAEMLVTDIMGGKRIQRCECCEAPFISEAYQARYCSERCRLRQQKRNLRARMKEARALYLEGKDIHQISRRLQYAPEIIQRWVAAFERDAAKSSS